MLCPVYCRRWGSESHLSISIHSVFCQNRRTEIVNVLEHYRELGYNFHFKGAR